MRTVPTKTLALAAAFAAVTACASALAQNFPAKPIRLVVSGAAGGSLDIPARAVANRLRDRLTMIVENRPAAGGTVAVNDVAKSAPDGYTLVFGFNGPLAYAPFLFSKLPYDPLRDLTPVIWMGGQPFTLGVSASLGVNTVKELIELLRKNPGKYNYASLGNGSGSHLTMELLKSQARLEIVHVPYRGFPPVVQDLLPGTIQATFAIIPAVLPNVKAGRLKGLAVTSEKRSPLAPDVPTVAEQGFPRFDATVWIGLLAPAGVPKDVLDKLAGETQRAMADAEVRKRLNSQGFEVVGGTPEHFERFIRSETEKWTGIVKLTGAKAD